MQPSPAADRRFSFFTPLGYQVSDHCGYCKSKKATSACSWASSTSVHVSHYQTLVDRGWRRSGTQFYKPNCRDSCCPHYTIRLDASEFKSTKDQRQAVNRWNQYILGQEYKRKAARLCPKTRQEKKRRRTHFDLCESVHEAEYKNVKRPIERSTTEPIEPDHRFEVTLEPDHFTEEKYALFTNYQKNVHREPPSKISRNGFRRFLCSGLKRSVQDAGDGKEKKLGSYHQCYRLDGRLIALGVLDLLPHCVSSVYLLYHNSVSDWNFGKLSALQEIALAVEGGYRYYYMGFYIHSCVKMRYKGTYHPTYLLDPETYAWDLLDPDLLARLSTRKYVSLSRERALSIPPHSTTSFLQSDALTTSTFSTELALGLGNFKHACNYVNGHPHELAIKGNGRSLFEINMPGVMSADEVREKVDLGSCKIAVGAVVTELENLVGWEDSEITDTFSIKGLVAEFVACVGPELLRETCIKWEQ